MFFFYDWIILLLFSLSKLPGYEQMLPFHPENAHLLAFLLLFILEFIFMKTTTGILFIGHVLPLLFFRFNAHPFSLSCRSCWFTLHVKVCVVTKYNLFTLMLFLFMSTKKNSSRVNTIKGKQTTRRTTHTNRTMNMYICSWDALSSILGETTPLVDLHVSYRVLFSHLKQHKHTHDSLMSLCD